MERAQYLETVARSAAADLPNFIRLPDQQQNALIRGVLSLVEKAEEVNQGRWLDFSWQRIYQYNEPKDKKPNSYMHYERPFLNKVRDELVETGIRHTSAGLMLKGGFVRANRMIQFNVDSTEALKEKQRPDACLNYKPGRELHTKLLRGPGVHQTTLLT